MKTMEFNLVLDEARSPKEQIREFLRDEILTKKIREGTRLPSTEALAEMWGTHAATIHGALTELVKEGWLVRLHGRGTFVRRREEKLTRVGLYYSARAHTPFEASLRSQLERLLVARGVTISLWIDPRPEDQENVMWPALLAAAKERKIQALIVPGADRTHLRWQTKLPVPTSFLCSANIPNGVSMDFRQLAELSLRALAEQGCRSVGLICPLATKNTPPDEGGRHLFEDFFEHFTDVSGECGLSLKNEWMRLLPDEHAMRGRAEERFGYEEFQRLWQQKEKPQGLIVMDDTVARGMLLALAENRVRVPEDLKLVLHKNAGIDLLCPVPATFVVADERQLAQALIEQVQKQARGELCQATLVPFSLARN